MFFKKLCIFKLYFKFEWLLYWFVQNLHSGFYSWSRDTFALGRTQRPREANSQKKLSIPHHKEISVVIWRTPSYKGEQHSPFKDNKKTTPNSPLTRFHHGRVKFMSLGQVILHWLVPLFTKCVQPKSRFSIRCFQKRCSLTDKQEALEPIFKLFPST